MPRRPYSEIRAERQARWDKEDREREERLKANRERRGNPQRFTLTGMIAHHHTWEEPIIPTTEDEKAGTYTVQDTSWTLPEIDPPMEQDEIMKVVDAVAYDRLVEQCIKVIQAQGGNPVEDAIEDLADLIGYRP